MDPGMSRGVAVLGGHPDDERVRPLALVPPVLTHVGFGAHPHGGREPGGGGVAGIQLRDHAAQAIVLERPRSTSATASPANPRPA